MAEAILTIDIHGMNRHKAKIAIDSALRKSYGIYHIRIIHGYHSGTELREYVRNEYCNHPKIIRLEMRDAGITTLILREI